MSYSITDQELLALTRAIYSRYGIDFTNYEPLSFKRRINRVIDRYDMDNSLDLWRKVIYEKDFVFTFIDEITVGLTEMFRNTDFWEFMRDKVIPEIAHKDRVDIWHAGCSTGEEVYTFAIMLHEAGILRRCKVYATDLNRNSVQSASEGVFSRSYEDAFRKSFDKIHTHHSFEYYFKIDAEKDQMIFKHLPGLDVNFEVHNLSRDPVKQNFDIIFCRNVMIYFDEKLKEKVVKLFHQHLKSEGLFFIGYYDSLPSNYKDYFQRLDAGTKSFRKLS
ncbi:MAG: protein-glutamate O-methyltransferase CheR [Cyclobacteriaceae bacterium]|nr:protein-glutamate O-methyltransferase CheR [Cyclobacteriaceae bacterium]MCH8516736.1 protein-glutamate O-methyltransferase CheR [Cyclobacteriaceae bacterium]